MQGVALQTAFRILPGIAAKQVVFSCKVKQLPERSLLSRLPTTEALERI